MPGFPRPRVPILIAFALWGALACGRGEPTERPAEPAAPDRTAARVRMAEALLAEGHLDAAREQFQKLAQDPAQQITPERQPEWFEGVIESLLRRRALVIADSMLALTGPMDGRSAQVQALSANLLVLEGRIEEALGTWAAIRTDDPALQVRVHHELATLYLMTGRAREAFDEAQRGLVLHPNHEPLRILLAEALRAQGKPRLALQELGQLPESTARRTAEADIYLRSIGQPDTASAYLRAAVRSAPQDPALRQMLAESEIAAGRPQNAITTLHRLATLPVPFEGSRELLADAFRRLGRVASADSLRAILDAEDRATEITELRIEGLRASMAGELVLALERFDAALALDDTQSDLFNDRGAVLARLERFTEAERDFLRAEALAPEDPTVQENLGRLYDRMGDVAKRDAAIARWRELKAQ